MYESALKLLQKITELGYDAYIVGGYARDLYLDIPSYDIDICTSAKKEQLNEVFNIKKSAFGCNVIEFDNYEFEVTTFRRELSYSKNRYPKIEYTISLDEDLCRRDFTINALCIDSNGQFIDKLNSIGDISNKVIRCIGNSDKKIEEDALRILRAIRFATVLNFKIDDELYNSIKKFKTNLLSLNKNKIKEEINKIMLSPNCNYGIQILQELEIDVLLNINIT